MEKSLFNQVGEVKGASSEKEDSFSFQFTPQNENLKRTRGSLFTLVTIEGKVENRYEKAKNIYHQFQSSYYAKASGSILHGLSDTLEHLAKEGFKKEEEAGVKVSLIAAVFWGTVVYLAKSGNGAVFVNRGDKTKKLDFAKVASGVLEDKDTICLSSEAFAEKVSLETLSESLNKEKFEEALESLDKEIEKVEGASCDVIRLSINAPSAAPEEIAIAQVDEKGEIEEKEEPELEKVEEVRPEPTKPELDTQDPFEKIVPKKQTPIAPVWEKAKTLVAGLFTKLARPWRKSAPGELFDPVAVRKARIAQVVGAILIILVVSIGFGLINRSAGVKEDKVGSIVSEVERSLNEANNIKSIDPTRALVLVNDAQKDLEEAKKLDSDNQQVTSLQKKSNELEAEITRTTKIENLETTFDFAKTKQGAVIDDLALLEDRILLIDRNSGTLFNLALADKSASEVSGTSGSLETVAAYLSGFYLSTSNGITRIDSSLKLTSVGSSANWGKITSSATYQNNLYLLDSEKNEVWRYLATSAGLGGARAYISGDKPDMSSAVAIAIDDLVWVATKNGSVYKFASGKKQEDFKISGLADPIGELSDMFTSTATKSHYFLDKGKGRVIATDKTGVYLASYAHAELYKADNLVVDETQKIVYFTSNSKLYQFKLP